MTPTRPRTDHDRHHGGALDDLARLLDHDMACVNRVIMAEMQSAVPLIPEVAAHLIQAGGKRIRPLLTLAGARLSGYGGPSVHTLAAAVEFIHTATLLHDDVVDESDRRRHLPAAQTIWGNSAAVLVGDFLFSRSFQLMVREGSLDVLRVLSDTSATISEGEVMQLSTARNLDTPGADYLAVIERKTAALFAAACEIGPILAHSPPPHQGALKAYGHALGIAFQLVDDVLDYGAAGGERGKNIGDDFREGKITYPVAYAYSRGNGDEKKFWEAMIHNPTQEGDFEQAQAFLTQHDAFGHTLSVAEKYSTHARTALSCFHEHPIKTALENMTYFVLERAT